MNVPKTCPEINKNMSNLKGIFSQTDKDDNSKGHDNNWSKNTL